MTATPTAKVSDADPALSALGARGRAQIGAVWAARAHTELRASLVFADLHRELTEFGAPVEVLQLSARAASDEVRHSAVCAEVAERYTGSRPAIGPVMALPAPVFSVCSGRVARALFASLHCAVNETLSTAVLGACLDEATSLVAKAALREIITDEVEHARIGWAVLASDRLSPADRATIASTMPILLDVCITAWLADEQSDYPDDLALGHGCLPQRRIAGLVADMLANVIAPGLDHVRIDSTPARAWIATRSAL